jgi:cobalt-zinc-cadmium resistance protein CzcA
VRDSLLALAGIPFAIGGGIIALYVTNEVFSISAAIGFISLFGVSVMNGILVLTYFNQLRLGGLGRLDAMFQAAEKRMRPMLMTALSAAIGLLPAAMSHGIGSEVQRPLATVVVGGMLIGPVMLLVIVPALQMALLGNEDNPEPASRTRLRAARERNEDDDDDD